MPRLEFVYHMFSKMCEPVVDPAMVSRCATYRASPSGSLCLVPAMARRRFPQLESRPTQAELHPWPRSILPGRSQAPSPPVVLACRQLSLPRVLLSELALVELPWCPSHARACPWSRAVAQLAQVVHGCARCSCRCCVVADAVELALLLASPFVGLECLGL
ncbi:uncharacterized protein [Zea mays]|uniref:Uncharacterized protein n=1 Tax=Zea mays TaxID=4577 RepID=B4FPT3_MAIZE|nr:uncharacterized protein LOC100272655 [Zea mays]XP_008676757.1 uncharacterized protein LOC100272655 isoform X1 [Zea mays]ACF84126.1 unknown [Zea mays]|eukprot:NP_001140585.1 uncharacterized protein LOC100272655 [Zea mays]